MIDSYLFYDVETTGLNVAFDQVLQFAAIRTDQQLKVLDEYEIRIKLRDDIIPSPEALIIHQLGIKEIAKGTHEFDGICQIHKLLNTPGTVSLGYNTLNFDDEFLRFSFYRNLLPPYTHQYANLCGRMDIFPIAVFYYLYKPDVIKWPQLDNKISLKLEHINDKNQLTEGPAHDAMVDVQATLELARRFYAETDMWEYICGYFDKTVEMERLKKLPQQPYLSPNSCYEALMIHSKFGREQYYQTPVLYLGQHQVYKNQSLWLKLDDPNLSQADSKPWVIRKKYGEPGFLLPPVGHYLKHLSEERLQHYQTNKQWLTSNTPRLREIAQEHCKATYPELDNVDIDAALYQNGFLSDHDRLICQRFIQADPKDKLEVIKGCHDPITRQLAQRVIARNFPDITTDEEYLQPSQTDHRQNTRLTPEKALQEITELKKTPLSQEQITILDDLRKRISTVS